MNFAINKAHGEYILTLNPDTILHQSTLKNLINELNVISDFSIASPLNDDPNFPNYKKSNVTVLHSLIAVDPLFS